MYRAQQWILGLTTALLAGAAFADEKGSTPASIQRRAAQGTAISCPHFRARVRSDLNRIGELLWNLDGSAGRDELKDYFKNRMAADPYDVAGQRVADVSWSLPRAEFPAGGQVVAIYELVRQDYSGAQMKFEVPDRAVELKDSSVEIRTPVRMVDVCVNGYIELQVLSACPVDELKFWRPTPLDTPATQVIAPLECKKMDTVRLSLAGVEATLEGEKSTIARGVGSVSLPVASGPVTCDGENVKAANLLESLRSVRQLHNCEIDVVKRESAGEFEYSIYARDIYACKASVFACLESEVSFVVPASCMTAIPSVSPSVHFASGVSRAGGDFAAELNAQLNRGGQLQLLSLSHLDRKTGHRDDNVVCRPDLGRRNYAF